MSRRAFRVAYDGRSYHGFQRQPDVDTVERALFDALDEVLAQRVDHEHPPAGYSAAGRTDAGVSAVAQTIAFDAPPWLTPRVLTGALPDAIRVWREADAPSDFHARHDAAERRYNYYLHRDRHDEFDRAEVREALGRLSGTHDFLNLSADSDRTRRSVTMDLHVDAEFYVFEFEAQGFPRQFVRRAVSVVIDIGCGVRESGVIDAVLDTDPLPGPIGVEPAPAGPLVLSKVVYPSLRWAPTDASPLSEPFERKRMDTLSKARVLKHLADGLRSADER